MVICSLSGKKLINTEIIRPLFDSNSTHCNSTDIWCLPKIVNTNIDDFNPAFFHLKDRKRWFYKTRGSLWFLKMLCKYF